MRTASGRSSHGPEPPRVRRHLPAAVAIFATAFLVRWWFLQGLILGDDGQELSALQQILASGPDLHDQLQVRFAGWIWNWVAFRLFGMSETTLLLPTWILSSGCGVIAYALLVHWRYGRARALAGGLLVATMPFEIVLGTLRTNDLYLGGAGAFGLLALVLLEDRPVRQGVALALCWWFGFYVKLFAVYALPALGLYWLVGRRWRSLGAFVASSLVVHGATLLFWKARTGVFLPFISTHAANYPVTLANLPVEWSRYPYMIFVGSEFGTTLFGLAPWLLVLLLAVRIARDGLDRPDRLLLCFWGSFFLLLEFFPAGFSLDTYYTVPRIFRYLAPISFPIALHLAKLVLDVSRGWRPAWAAAFVSVLIALQLLGAVDATLPGRTFRRALLATVNQIVHEAPPRVVAEITLGYWLERMYLDPDLVETEVTRPPDIYVATDCERWIHDSAPGWPTGTLLVTGLGNYVHYGAHTQGLRLAQFERPLDDRWTLVGEYESLAYLPRPETARLWRLVRGNTGPGITRGHDDPLPPGPVTPAERMSAGMQRLQKGDSRGARAYFRAVMGSKAPEAEDATFFYAVTFFREERWPAAEHAFKQLRARYPKGHWIPAVHWHVGIADARQGHIRRARARFASIVRRFPQDPVTVENARAELRRLAPRGRGLVQELWHRWVRGEVS
jgi:hypothetical protein